MNYTNFLYLMIYCFFVFIFVVKKAPQKQYSFWGASLYFGVSFVLFVFELVVDSTVAFVS